MAIAFRRAAGLLLLAGVLFQAACARAPEGWQNLWPDEWQWFNHGEVWVRGVPAHGRQVEVQAGQELRFELFNLGTEEAVVRLSGFAGAEEWRIGAGVSRAVDLRDRSGLATFHAPANVVLGSPRVGRMKSDPRVVVFVLVDTLRADHVNEELMPRTTAFFADGRRWTRATANASWTLPSVASTFASRPVLDLTSPEGDLIGIPEGMDTWIGRLGEAGFTGAAVVANYSVAVLNGFGEGFASYRVPDGHGHEPHPDAAWVVEGGRRALASHRGEDVFLYLHLMDPHHPYRPHEEPDVEVPDLIALSHRRFEASAEETEVLARLYRGEVRHVDEVLAPFLEELPDGATVVFTSDHGEGLGEHGCWAHGLNLYQESLAVPLMMRGPRVPGGVSDELVQLLDLGPTVLDLAGIAPAESMLGRSILRDGSRVPVVSSTFGAGPLRWAWQEGSDKIVLRMAAQPGLGAEARTRMEEELPLEPGGFHFDLEADPGEDAPRPVGGEMLARMGPAFATTAARMVPGLQLVFWNGPGEAEVEVELDDSFEVVQAWSTGAMTVTEGDGGLRLSCENAFPLCALSLATGAGAGQVTVARGGPSDTPYEVVAVEPPAELLQGLLLWRNPERSLVVQGYEETMERLRALGYLQ